MDGMVDRIVEDMPVRAVKRTVDDGPVDPEHKRTRSDDREVNVDPIHDTPFGLCLQARTFLVGPRVEPFVIHRDLIRQRCSKYWQLLQDKVKLDTSLPNHWSYRLVPDDSRTFAMFVAWLYTGEIPPSPDDEMEWTVPNQLRLVPGQDGEYERWYDEDLVDLWIFAATNQIFELSNAAVSSLAMQNDKYNRTTTRGALLTAFNYSGPTLGLQKYLVDEAVIRLGSFKVPKNTCNYPVEYVAKILEEIMARQAEKPHGPRFKRLPARWHKRPCFYHTHPPSPNVVAEKRECRQFWRSSPTPRYDEEIYELLVDTVVIAVGPSKIPFVVHKGLLRKHSPFFRELFHSDHETAKTGRYELEADSVRDFILFLAWLYFEKVQTPSPAVNAMIDKYLSMQDRSMTLWSAPPSSDDSGFFEFVNPDATHENDGDNAGGLNSPTSEVEGPVDSAANTVVPPDASTNVSVFDDGDESSPTPGDDIVEVDNFTRMKQVQSDLISLFIFAENRDVPRLRNDIMNRLIELRSKRWPLLTADPALIRRCYTALSEASDLCDYLEEEAAFCWNFADHKWLLDEATELPPAFLGNVLLEIFRERLDTEEERKPSWCDDVCYFHHHKNDEEEQVCRGEMKKWQEELALTDYAAVDAPELEW